MFTRNQTNPLLARSNRARGNALSALAIIGILAAGTYAVSAQTPVQQQGPQLAATSSALGELRAAINEPASQPRRQVRVIPLFNTPGNQTGK